MKLLFIIGINPRCGTNFLQEIMLSHPHCSKSQVTGEDNVLSNLHILDYYFNRMNSSWRPTWNNSIRDLESAIMSGLKQFLTRGSDNESAYCVFKTPKPQNIHLFRKYFPDDKMLFLVRDGRDIIDSYIKTFNVNFVRACFQWHKNAKVYLHYRRITKPFNNILIVKYENLISNSHFELERIASFLDLPYILFSESIVHDLPVIGSSQNLDVTGKISWDKNIPLSNDYTFLGRYKKWPLIYKAIFYLFFGKTNNKLGYY